MAGEIAADRTIHARLIKDMARRLRYTWLMYVLFCVFFSMQAQFRGTSAVAIWTLSALMVAAGLLRMWGVARLVNLPDDEVQAASRIMLGFAAMHSVLWGSFVTIALLSANGNSRLEMWLGFGVAAFATGGAVVLAAYRPLSWLHLGIQCIPMLVWSICARDRVGLLMSVLMVSFVIFASALMVAHHAHIVNLFRTQLLLEIRGEELRRARDTAEEASSARAQFLANMSHEIRTPLHGVLGLTQLLSETPLNEAQKELLSALTGSGGHLLSIVNDILDCSKIASGRLTLESVSFDLCTLVKDAATPAEAMVLNKGLRWIRDCPAEVAGTYRGDPVRLRQILTNLLSNAVKFTESGEVRLTVERPRPGWIAFTVADTGIGIREDRFQDLFQDFTQADASTTRRFGGTGLGLSISKRLVELMGGTLSLESKLGSGSRFTAAIPLPEVREAGCPATPATCEGMPFSLPTGRRILLAEDNPVNRMIAQRFLAGTGCAVETAATGRVAVSLHTAKPFDLILMDCHMPDMDGFEATVAIRALDKAAEVPIIAITASAFAEDRERCRRAGMNGYLAKPLRREALLDAISNCLREHESGADALVRAGSPLDPLVADNGYPIRPTSRRPADQGGRPTGRLTPSR